MARTVAQVLTRVGETLQDVNHVRYTPAQLVSHLNDAIQLARDVRADLFVYAYAAGVPDFTASDTAAELPVPDAFFSSICNYVAGAAELRDDEFAVDGRAMTLRSTLREKLMTGV